MSNYVQGYNGNPLLKKTDTAIEWTREMQDEYIACMEDPIYFAEKYIKIISVDDGVIPIKLYDYQKEIIQNSQDNRRVCVVTSRQAGKTTTACVIILHYILFNKHKLVALLANKGDAAREILERVKMSYEELPGWLQSGIKTWNKGSIELANGCKVIAGATTSSAIRGKSASYVYIDETAFVENWDKFFSSVYPVLASGKTTKLLFTSTPNGLNHFYKVCEGAKSGENGYAFTEVSWQRVPGRDKAWYDETLQALNGDTEQFAQEFECDFQGSSGTLISGSTLKTLVQKTPITIKDGLLQYELPAKEKQYVISADVSEGKNLDYSAFHVIDVTKMPYIQVCAYRNNMTTPLDYASIIHMVAKLYNNATILVENNSVGGQVVNSLYYDYDCENIVCTENAGAAGKRISSGFGSNTIERGVRMTTSVKRIGCSMLKLLVEQQQLIINDFHTIEELSRFSKKGNSYEAETGANDDLVMGLVSFAWMSDQKYFRELTDISTLENLRDRTNEQIENEMVPFGFIETGHEEDYESIIDLTSNPRPEFVNF